MATAKRRPNQAPAAAEVREIRGAAVDDATLVRRAIDGDRWAEEALYRRHVRRVSDVAIRVLGRAHEAEDVVQDTFLKALSKLGSLRDPSLFPRWLMRIAMNMVRSKLRKRRLLRTLGLDRTVDDATLERAASPSTPPDVRAELAGIDAVLRDVPSEARVAWMLHVVEGWSLPETAETIGCSLATVKRRIRRAKDRIDEHLADPAVLAPRVDGTDASDRGAR